VESLLKRLNDIGFERTRRAVAALTLSLLLSFHLVIALLLFLNGQTALVPALIALSVCYGVAFMGVAAEWFWGRWFAEGLGWSGVMIAVASLVMIGGWQPFLGIFGAAHGLVVLMLAGKKMAERFDLQPAWRERYGMDEFGVARLRKTVTRASASLPSVILWALAPKEPGQGMALTVVALATGALAVGGLSGVVRLRSWGLVALAASVALLAPFASFGHGTIRLLDLGCPMALGWVSRLFWGGTIVPAALLLLAVLPFAVPAARFLRRR
jgi:hypothetical protein